MSADAFGLLLQAVAAILILVTLRRHVLTYTGGIFLLVAIAYHGLTEIVQAIFPGYNERYRTLVEPWALERWIFEVSVAIMYTTVGYLIVVRRPRREPPQVQLDRLPPWWVWAALAVPALLIKIRTQTFGVVGGLQASDSALSTGFAVQFAELFLILAGIQYARTRPGALPVVLAVQALCLFAIGSRLTAIAAIVATLAVVQLTRTRPLPPRFLALAGTAGFILLALLNDARERVNRYVFLELGLIDRLKIMGDSITDFRGDVFLKGFVYRFDGNTFGALVSEGLARGIPPTGITPLVNTVWLAIPSAFNPGKLATTLEQRSEKIYAADHFGFTKTIDFLPTTYGPLAMYGGLIWLVVASVLLGVALGLVDRRVHQRLTPTTLVVYIGVLYTVVSMERGIAGWTITLRGIVALLIVQAIYTWFAHSVRLYRERHTPISQQWQRL